MTVEHALLDLERVRRATFVGGGAPLVIERAEGAYLHAADGRRILDAGGGAIVVNIGHGREEVAEAAAQALRDLSYVIPPFMTPQKLRLVERLRANWLPEGLTRVTFVSGGSESVEAAIRLARQHHVCAGRPGRWKVIGTDLSYHGVSLGALSVGGHATRRRGFEPMLIPFPKAPAPYSLADSLGRTSEDSREHAADALQDIILREGPDTVAAFICEPMVGSAGGANVPPPSYWPRVAEICKRYGVLLIADEVMTGFGRTGLRFGVEHWGVTPDIMVAGKGLSGGYAPIGGMYATDAVVAPLLDRGEDLMFYTFSAHPMACAVADKVLEIMEREDLVARAEKMGGLLRSRLEAELGDHPNVAQVRGLGLLLGIELVQDRDSLRPFPPEARLIQRVVAVGLQNGVFFYPGGSGPSPDVVMLGPPFIINGEDIDILVSALRDSIDAAVREARAAL
jgi:adenosylmethionine-8-amino-7-oxononanoate aminotransferase